MRRRGPSLPVTSAGTEGQEVLSYFSRWGNLYLLYVVTLTKGIKRYIPLDVMPSVALEKLVKKWRKSLKEE